MAERLSDQILDRVDLPMSRYDIADYLALSVETVSRAMTDLQQRGAIALAGTRRVTIVDRHAFQEPDNDDLPGPMRRTTAAGHGARPRDATWRVTRSTSPGHTTGDPTVDITARRIASAR
jgi:DNA-binding transcriptional MocR family regulator